MGKRILLPANAMLFVEIVISVLWDKNVDLALFFIYMYMSE
jgi:hypothetical protein